MQLNELKTNHKPKSRKKIGRGGKRGTYSGHGGKGQTARSGRKFRPVIRDIIKRYPKLRGYKNRPVGARQKIVNLNKLEEKFQKEEIVNPKTLYKKNLITRIGGVLPKVKILGSGVIKKPLIIKKCAVSKTAREKIEKAGGKIEP